MSPGAAANLAYMSGDAQAGTVNSSVASNLVVTVTDAFGNAVSGTNITWNVATGSGSLSTVTNPTDSSGHSSVSLKLGIIPGANSVTASAAGLAGSPVTFSATGLQGAWTATTTTNAPSAATSPGAVWTGSKMIVWGGELAGTSLAAGAIYDPVANSWTTMTATGAPSARSLHAMLWTGSKVIVWGGYDDTNSVALATGAIYDPVADSWTNITNVGAPLKRFTHSTAWTGSKMIVWGGRDENVTYYTDGAIYDPTANSWSAINNVGAPTGRSLDSTVWTGSKMIVWGGVDSGGTNLNTGGIYNPATDSWSATTTIGAPEARILHTAVWTGSKMIVWGGSDATVLNNGGLYDPASDSWTATSTGTNVPPARQNQTAVWTGAAMIIWGGTNGALADVGDMGLYDPSVDKWGYIAAGQTNEPGARSRLASVWTGSKMIVWGGGFNTGGVWDPQWLSQMTWTGIASGAANEPVARYLHAAVWTGSKLVIWGGVDSGGTQYADGGVFDPVSGSWSAIASGAANEPTARYLHTGVWAGGKVVVWGGYDGAAVKGDGGAYDPVAGTWTAIAAGAGSEPGARSRHAALSTGDKMIVWGGFNEAATDYQDGGIFDVGVGTWTSIASGMANEPSARYYPAMVYTGSTIIVWGGHNFNCAAGCVDTSYNDGGIYNIASNSWTAIANGLANTPTVRERPSAFWTGSKMIVWGGDDLGTYRADGGLYDPAANSWASIAGGAANEPGTRSGNGGVWTGSKLIIWGGINLGVPMADGGIYDPSAGTWTAISAAITNTPAARYSVNAVWTGGSMLVWGGYDSGGTRGDGGIFKPFYPPW